MITKSPFIKEAIVKKYKIRKEKKPKNIPYFKSANKIRSLANTLWIVSDFLSLFSPRLTFV